MPVFKIISPDGSKKKFARGSTIEQVLNEAQKKFDLPEGNYQLLREMDGMEIDEDDILLELAEKADDPLTLLVLPEGSSVHFTDTIDSVQNADLNIIGNNNDQSFGTSIYEEKAESSIFMEKAQYIQVKNVSEGMYVTFLLYYCLGYAYPLKIAKTLEFLQRQMVGRILLEYFKSAVEANSELNVDEVFNTVHQIVSDPEPSIRLDLVEQLPHVAIMCQDTPHLFGDVVSRYIIGIILKYLRDSDNQVRQTAQAALIAIVERGILSKKQLECEVCPVILNMTYMQIEFLNTAIVLISKLGPYMGSELLERVLLDRYLILCENEQFFVRKVCASYLGEICENISKEVVYKKLLPKYINLCMDEVWGVRKACVDVMLSVASCVKIYEYRIVLSKLFGTQLNDESKWVRTSAYQILGPFISIFSSEFTGLRYNQFGDFVMSHNQGYALRQNIIPSMKNESVVGPNDIFATPLEREIGILGIDMYASNKGKVPSNGKKTSNRKKKNDSIFCPITNWLGEIAESEEQTDSLGEASGDNVNKFNSFQYYYIRPEMPLDLELIHPNLVENPKSSEGEEEAFEDDFFFETRSQREQVDEDIDSNREPSGESTSLESSNLSSENTENVDNSNTEKIKEESTEESKQNSEEESMNKSDYLDHLGSELCKESRKRNILMKRRRKKDLVVEINSFMKLSKQKDADEIVPQFLINFFVSMVDPSPLTDIGSEIHHQCAFYFPAVVMTLGRNNWYQLKNAYQALAGAVQWKVRCTLASSIHEIALILGEELAGSDLMPIYDGFIKDLDEVRIGALKHLSTFLKVLRPADRQQYLPKLSDFLVTDTEWNWRFREQFANQLLLAVPLYKPEDISEHIAPLALQLLQDKVAAVRQVALSLVTKITMYLGAEESLAIALIQEINHLLIFNKWTCRQTYALICSQLIRTGSINIEIFAKEMLPHLLTLSADKVPNVRLVVARTLATDVIPIAHDWLDADLTKSVMKKLQQDPDRDVRVLAGGHEVNEAGDQNLRHTYLLDAF